MLAGIAGIASDDWLYRSFKSLAYCQARGTLGVMPANSALVQTAEQCGEK